MSQLQSGKEIKLDRVMEGELDEIIQALMDEDQKQRMAEGN